MMWKVFVQFLFLCILNWNIADAYAQRVADYNVVWKAPSKNSAGSMPLGNGELGMNVWVEENGDLLFYLSRTDALSEANRLMKLGRVRMKFSPNPFQSGMPFLQTLLLNEGAIEIRAGEAREQVVVRIYMDTSSDVAYVALASKQKREVTVIAESWRKEPHVITAEEAPSTWTIKKLPPDLVLEESADVFPDEKNAISWYHANRGSQLYDLTMTHQDKLDYKAHFPDPVSHRVFGVYMTGKEFVKVNDSTFSSVRKISDATLKIATHSAQVESVEDWKKQIRKVSEASSEKTALARSKKWWKEYWDRSYIYVDIPADQELGYALTQSYILQRFMAASSGRGNFPIKFNGSIFNVDSRYVKKTTDYGPDFRNWGNEFWWQNTCLPYYAMFASGDFDLIPSLFRFYLERMDAFRVLAHKYYGAKGIFIPETVSVFGTYGNGDWGWDRNGLTSKDVNNLYIRYIWVQGLELSKIMLDYYFYTGDTAFLVEKALPVVKDVLLYFDSRFVNEEGKMNITPTQALETYWYDVVNDMPCIAGLHAVLATLAGLPDSLMEREDRTFFDRLRKTLPDLPVRETPGGNVFLPAQHFLNQRNNIENPELYAIFPFGLSNLTNDLKETGIRSFQQRVARINTGWPQDGQTAAMLGLREVLPAMLKEKINNTNVNHRFPAMWGPNYDWVPDQDHGSNILLTLQYMLLQAYEGKAYLLPAWPKDWNVVFKLWAPGQTSIKGEFKNGRLLYTKQGRAAIIEM